MWHIGPPQKVRIKIKGLLCQNMSNSIGWAAGMLERAALKRLGLVLGLFNDVAVWSEVSFRAAQGLYDGLRIALKDHSS